MQGVSDKKVLICKCTYRVYTAEGSPDCHAVCKMNSPAGIMKFSQDSCDALQIVYRQEMQLLLF